MKAMTNDDGLILLPSDIDVTSKSLRYNMTTPWGRKVRVYSFGAKAPVAAWCCGIFVYESDVWVTLDETD